MRKLTRDKPINYLKKERKFLVVDRSKEAIGRTIKRIARETITTNDNVTLYAVIMF